MKHLLIDKEKMVLDLYKPGFTSINSIVKKLKMSHCTVNRIVNFLKDFVALSKLPVLDRKWDRIT